MTMPLRIIIAEDSAVVRGQLEQLVGNLEHIEIVEMVEDGDAAVTAIAERSPDLVLLDVHMPRRNGLEVLRAIRPDFEGRVIMLTNFADPLTRRRCLEAGADHFFDKSTEFREMLRVVRNYVTTASS